MRRLLAAAVITLGLTACGPSSGPTPLPTASPSLPPTSPAPSATPSAAPSATSAPSGLVFRVIQAGGFIAPSAELGVLPSVSVYADGTIVLPGPVQAVDPAPALPSVVVERVTPAGLATILDAAKATGLADPTASFDGGPAPDAGVTLITIDLAGLPRNVRVSSLGDASRDAALDPKVAAARAKLRVFLATFGDLAKLVGPDGIGLAQPYRATAMRLIVNPGDPSGGNTKRSIAWPLSTPLTAFGAEVASTGAVSGAAGLNGGGAARCGTVSGADLATLLAAAASATVLTPWTSAGQSYGITFRPLLRDETGCPGA